MTRLGLALRTKSLNDELRLADVSLRSAVLTDSLTGLANRRAAEERLRSALAGGRPTWPIDVARGTGAGDGAGPAVGPAILTCRRPGTLDGFAEVKVFRALRLTPLGDLASRQAGSPACCTESCRAGDTVARLEAEAFLLLACAGTKSRRRPGTWPAARSDRGGDRRPGSAAAGCGAPTADGGEALATAYLCASGAVADCAPPTPGATSLGRRRKPPGPGPSRAGRNALRGRLTRDAGRPSVGPGRQVVRRRNSTPETATEATRMPRHQATASQRAGRRPGGRGAGRAGSR